MYNCAIVGCGNIAGGYGEDALTHAGAYKLCPATNLVAASDNTSKSLMTFGKRWKVDRLYKDYKKMLSSEKIDILSICLPTEKHYEVFKAACGRGVRAIFCEKPLSRDIDEAREMVRMSRGRTVSVNYFRRWNSDIARLREGMSRGDYGKIINVTARYTKGLFVNGSHLIDLMLWFFGKPKTLQAIRVNHNGTKDPGADFTIDFQHDITVHFLNIPDAGYVFIDVDILTKKGRISITQRGQAIERYSIAVEPYYQKFHMLKKGKVVQTAWRDCLRRAVEEIVKALDTQAITSCSPKDALKTLEICHEIIKRKRT